MTNASGGQEWRCFWETNPFSPLILGKFWWMVAGLITPDVLSMCFYMCNLEYGYNEMHFANVLVLAIYPKVIFLYSAH